MPRQKETQQHPATTPRSKAFWRCRRKRRIRKLDREVLHNHNNYIAKLEKKLAARIKLRDGAQKRCDDHDRLCQTYAVEMQPRVVPIENPLAQLFLNSHPCAIRDIADAIMHMLNCRALKLIKRACKAMTLRVDTVCEVVFGPWEPLRLIRPAREKILFPRGMKEEENEGMDESPE